MNVLAFDTSSPLPAIVLLWDRSVFEKRLAADRLASEALLPALATLLHDAGAVLPECSRIAVCAGPGSFTGVRVGLATAWGLGRATGIPVESVPTLEALAEAARAPGLERVAAVLDAGRGEVVLDLFTLGQDRARSLQGSRRLPLERAVALSKTEEIVSLPEDLLGFRGRRIEMSPARAAALAVARAPRAEIGAFPVAIYARASAAEEKLGAA